METAAEYSVFQIKVFKKIAVCVLMLFCRITTRWRQRDIDSLATLIQNNNNNDKIADVTIQYLIVSTRTSKPNISYTFTWVMFVVTFCLGEKKKAQN